MGDPEELPAAAPRKGPPRWMLWTGCGCVLPGFLLVAMGAFALQLGQKLFNQQTAYATLAQVIDYDDSLRGTPSGEPDDPMTPRDESHVPRDVDLILGGEVPYSGGVHTYWFARDVPVRAWGIEDFGPDPLRVSLVRMPSDQSDAATRAAPGTALHQDTRFEVNGQSLRARRLPEVRDEGTEIEYLHGVPEFVGPGAAVWLQERVADDDDDGTYFDLVAFFQRPRGTEPVREDEIQAFLAPFHLAPEAPGDAASPPSDGATGEEPR